MILISKLFIEEGKLLFFITNLRAFCIHFLQIVHQNLQVISSDLEGNFSIFFPRYALGMPSFNNSVRNAFLSIYVLISDVKSHFTYISNIALHDRSVQGLYTLHSAHALNPKRCGLFGQLRRRGEGGLKGPAERYWSLYTPILVLIKGILFHMKAGIFS